MLSLSNKDIKIEIPERTFINNEDETTEPSEDETTENRLVNYTLKERFMNLFTKEIAKNTTLFCGAWFLIWCFLIMLSLMGNGFKLLGMKDSSKMFDIVDNPISALMIGILVTVLVQSSSTSTSIIVGLVGADELSVTNAIPMIMGANIGTSVTNTIVSLGSYNNRKNYQRYRFEEVA